MYEKSSSWTNKPHAQTFKFDASSLKSSLKFVLENSYFSVGSVCYQQCIGVPIGVNCAPAIANLTLFSMSMIIFQDCLSLTIVELLS